MIDLYRPYLDFAVRTAWQAGQITLQYFQTDLKPDWKADATPVTAADRQSESYIRSQIESGFPGHAIIGEEYGHAETDSSFCWVIDPLDGTRSFVRGVPLYAVLIGLLVDGISRVGVAHFPALRETIWAASGQGCFYNGRLAHVSTTTELHESLLSTTDFIAFERAGKSAAWQRLAARPRHVTGWSDAYGYLLAATGRADIMIDPLMAVWDCGPFPVILEEAGGYFGDWKGQVRLDGNEGLATNRSLLPKVLEILNQNS